MRALVLRRITAVIFLIVGAAVETPNQQHSGTEDSLASIEGIVTDSTGGKPITGATVTALGSGGRYTAATDSTGHYVFSGIKPGKYRVFPVKEGYGRLMSARPRQIRASAGEKILRVDFGLAREAIITGRVVDDEKKPVTGVQVAVWASSFVDGQQALPYRGGAMTDDRGDFRILGLREGRYYIGALPTLVEVRKRRSADKYTGRGRAPDLSFVRTFYPRADALASAAPVPLQAGEIRESLDITLDRSEVFCVYATVVPVAAIASSSRVQVMLSEAGPGWSVTVAQGGSCCRGVRDLWIAGRVLPVAGPSSR